MYVNPNLSDLWFNHDHSAYTRHDAKGEFEGYDPDGILAEATTFLETLARLGVEGPSPEELVQDFYGRI